jgi:hypothetical protein
MQLLKFLKTKPINMLKYLFIPALAFSLIACNGDSDEMMSDQYPPEQPEQSMEDPMNPQQQTDTDISDEELERFLEVSSTVQQIQMEAQLEMVEKVEEEGLDVETYNQIAEARHMGQSDDELNVSDEQLAAFDRASENVEEMERDMESELTQAVEEEGMDMERFMVINMSLQQDPALQQRVQEMQEPQMQQDQQPQPETDGF